MKQQIMFRVETPSISSNGKRVKLFERIMYIDGSLCVPYETLISSARFLFGSDCIVTFEDCMI